MSITNMDANGRVLLPIGIRYRLDLNDGDKFAIDQLGDGTIILKKVGRRMNFKKCVIEKTFEEPKSLATITGNARPIGSNRLISRQP
jgi:AbrB family looped-hinge helix DNA binding protein